MYENESDQRYSLETLEGELRRKREITKGAIIFEIFETMDSVRRMLAGDSLDVISTVKGKGDPRVYVTIRKKSDGFFTVFTHYVGPDNHVRGQCLGVGEIPIGMEFAALGGNSKPPPNGFTRQKRRPVFLRIRTEILPIPSFK